MEIRAFEGYRYNLEKIGNLDDVVAPPYDVIDESFQEKLYQRHPNNVIRLILEKMYPTDSEADNRYTRTAKTLTEWKSNLSLAIVTVLKKSAISMTWLLRLMT